MDRGCIVVDKLDRLLERSISLLILEWCSSTYSHATQSPFQGFCTHALALDVPSQRYQPLGRDINVGFGLSNNQ